LSRSIPAVLVLGATATGKSALALALAEHFDGEIVSVDSAQVYRGMDIGTAKPDAATRARIPHHLIDVIEPIDAYSAARFARDAHTAIDGIRARGRVPILAGGTMLYAKALCEGLSALPPADPALRAQIDVEAARVGWPAMHAELARVDPSTAARLDVADAQRIQRAIEVFRATGVPLSSLQGQRSGAHLGTSVTIALMPTDRVRLHAAIATRFDAMLEAGLVAELEALRRRYRLTAGMSSMRAVGYRQAWQFIEGELDAAALRARGIAATRQLARRQLTWLRTMRATGFPAWDSPSAAIDFVARALSSVDRDGDVQRTREIQGGAL
jgi:tRNA dimethylallyltransferase